MDFISVMEIIGTVAFAATGALIAIEKDLDYFGISFLAIITAIGGGIIRDIIIDRKIPASLENPLFAIVSLGTVVFIIIFYKYIHHLNRIINICDAFGLAAFTAIGAAASTNAGYSQTFIIITTAVLTGTGGGLIRDVCVGEIPFIFEKEVYAAASIIGALSYEVAHITVSTTKSMYLAFAITLAIRLLSMKLNLHLGKVIRKK